MTRCGTTHTSQHSGGESARCAAQLSSFLALRFVDRLFEHSIGGGCGFAAAFNEHLEPIDAVLAYSQPLQEASALSRSQPVCGVAVIFACMQRCQ